MLKTYSEHQFKLHKCRVKGEIFQRNLPVYAKDPENPNEYLKDKDGNKIKVYLTDPKNPNEYLKDKDGKNIVKKELQDVVATGKEPRDGNGRRKYFENISACSDFNLGVDMDKNSLTVVDVDYGNMIENNAMVFVETFKDFQTRWNTCCVKTPNGYHLYFLKNPNMPNMTANATYFVDIRHGHNTFSHAIAPTSQIDGKKYHILHDFPIQRMPNELEEWILTHLYKTNKEKVKKDKQEKRIRKENGISEESIIANQENCWGKFYPLSPDLLKSVLNHLPKSDKSTLQRIVLDSKGKKTQEDICGNYTQFLQFTSAMKKLGSDYYELWDDICKKNDPFNAYDDTKNHNTYDSLDVNKSHCKIENYIQHSDNAVYYLRKPLPNKNTIKPDLTVNTQYITNIPNILDLLKEKRFVIVKSGMGTGKTHFMASAFIHLYKENPDLRLLNLVSRTVLAQNHVEVFTRRHNIDLVCYDNTDSYEITVNRQNVVIQIDSIVNKLKRMPDFSNYVVNIDEIHSLLKHLITSPTVKDRSHIFSLLNKILKEAHTIIGADADVDDIVLQHLQEIDVPFYYIHNTKSNVEHVIVTEVENEEDLIAEIAQQKDFLICCDSANDARVIQTKLKNLGVETNLLTADEDYFNLDQRIKVIISPKVVYGLDSLNKRPVYAFYTEKSINSQEMKQQLGRARHPDFIKFHFKHKKYIANPISYEEHEKKVIQREIMGGNRFQNQYYSNEDAKLYLTLLARYEYDDLCYKSNKYLHLCEMLRNAGYKVKLSHSKSVSKTTKEERDETEERRTSEFNIENSKRFTYLNKMLHVPKELESEYSKFFLTNALCDAHIHLSKYMTHNATAIHMKLKHDKDFNANKIGKALAKIKFLKDIEESLGVKKIGTFTFEHGLTQEQSRKYNEEYRQCFIVKAKKDVDLTDAYECSKFVAGRYKTLFGNDILTDERDTNHTKGSTRKRTYTFNQDTYDEHDRLYMLRNKKTEYCEDLEREVEFTKKYDGTVVYSEEIKKEIAERMEMERIERRDAIRHSVLVMEHGFSLKEHEE